MFYYRQRLSRGMWRFLGGTWVPVDGLKGDKQSFGLQCSRDSGYLGT